MFSSGFICLEGLPDLIFTANQLKIYDIDYNKEVDYRKIDFSEKDNAALTEKFKVTYTSLIIISDKDYKNLTEQVFALALRNPEELKALIAQETKAILNR